MFATLKFSLVFFLTLTWSALSWSADSGISDLLNLDDDEGLTLAEVLEKEAYNNDLFKNNDADLTDRDAGDPPLSRHEMLGKLKDFWQSPAAGKIR
jgi:hypothetical protein